MRMMESYSDGWSAWATALARITAIITGRMCEIWPVSSNTMTAVDTVWVTAPDRAAAPVNEGKIFYICQSPWSHLHGAEWQRWSVWSTEKVKIYMYIQNIRQNLSLYNSNESIVIMSQHFVWTPLFFIIAWTILGKPFVIFKTVYRNSF